MSKRDTRTPEEREREEMWERIERDALAEKERLDAPLTRVEVIDALENVANRYAATNDHDSMIVCNAFRRLAEALS